MTELEIFLETEIPFPTLIIKCKFSSYSNFVLTGSEGNEYPGCRCQSYRIEGTHFSSLHQNSIVVVFAIIDFYSIL